MTMNKIFGNDENQNPLSSPSDDRFQIIFDSVNDGIFISNPATAGFIEMNGPGCKMFGYAKPELIDGGFAAANGVARLFWKNS